MLEEINVMVDGSSARELKNHQLIQVYTYKTSSGAMSVAHFKSAKRVGNKIDRDVIQCNGNTYRFKRGFKTYGHLMTLSKSTGPHID